MDLSVGLVVVGLPFVLLFLPGIVLFVVMPAILLLVLAVPLAVIGALLIGPPVLLTRLVRRQRRPLSGQHAASPRGGTGGKSSRAASPVGAGG
jgi:hypothetical protein